MSRVPELPDLTLYLDALGARVLGHEIAGIRVKSPFLVRTFDPKLGEATGKAVRGLRSMKNAQDILKQCVEINRLENEADTLLRVAVGKLFKTERDPLTVMKWKELYETMEAVTDRCEDVVNVIEGITLKMA